VVVSCRKNTQKFNTKCDPANNQQKPPKKQQRRRNNKQTTTTTSNPTATTPPATATPTTPNQQTMWLVMFGMLLQLRVGLGDVLEATYNTSVAEFIPHEIKDGEQWGNSLQSQDYCLGQWLDPRNRLRAAEFTYEGKTWSSSDRTALRGELQSQVSALWGKAVEVDDNKLFEYFSPLANASECARLCLLLESEQSDPFKDLSCGGFEYEAASAKCWPAQKWITGRKYNTSCKIDEQPADSSTYTYCCESSCCAVGDRNCDSDQYKPRSKHHAVGLFGHAQNAHLLNIQ
jgi:hypothetical protein